MNPSLSVILPVCNAEGSLGPVVCRLLELLPDLAGSFEILIVDDASSDHTPEIADEWRRTYPQVRVIRHGWSWGLSAAIRTGRLECRGDQVIVVPSLSGFQPRDIIRQWAEMACSAAQDQSALNAPEAALAPPPMRRTEPAHEETIRPRERSFLRHLRQLSDVL